MRLDVRLIAIAAFTLAAIQFHTGQARACIKYDRVAEMALIDAAIKSENTPAAYKTTLASLRKDILVLRNKNAPTSNDVSRHHDLTTTALKLIGKQRIVWREPDATKSVKGDKRILAQSASPPACG